MDIGALAEQLNREQQDISHVLKQLNSITEEQINDQLHARRSVLSNFVTFCKLQLEKKACQHIVILFRVIHKLNASDHWLLTASNLLLPQLIHFYNTIVIDSDVRTLQSPIHATQNLSRVLKRNKHALRTLSAIFELCVDFCDVVCAEDHVAEFLKPCIALLSVSDFRSMSFTLTETDYALNELLRCASYALSNILLSFDSIAYSAKSTPTRDIQNIFKVLSCAPELSIQRSLIMSLRCLCDLSYGHPSLHNGQPDLSSIEQLIEEKLSSSQFGSSRAIPSFRELDVTAEDALEQSELVVTKMFWRKRKIHRSFNSRSCDVHITWTGDTISEAASSHTVVLRSVSVEWNTNAICVRDVDGNPYRHWPLFTVSHPEWEDNGRGIRLNFDAFYTYPATEVHIRFQAKSLTRRDRKAIDDRIDEIMSMASDVLTPGISKGNPQIEPSSATPMSVSLIQKKANDQSQADGACEQNTERRQVVETIFSKLNKDGVFLTKEAPLSSYVPSNENTSMEASDAEQARPAGNEESASSAGVQGMDSEPARQNSRRLESNDDVVNKEGSDMEVFPKARPPEHPVLVDSRKQKTRIRLRRNSERVATIPESRAQSLSRGTDVTSPGDKLIHGSAFPKDNVHADSEFDEVVESSEVYRVREERESVVRDEDIVKTPSKRLRRKRTPSPVCSSTDRVDKHPSILEQPLRTRKRRRNMISLSSESAVITPGNRSPSFEERPGGQYLKEAEHQSVVDIESEDGSLKNVLSVPQGLPETVRRADSPPAIEAGILENLAALSAPGTKRNTNPESKTLRNMLLSAIKQIANWQDDNSKNMLLSTKREVESLRDKKKTADKEKLKAFEASIKKRGREQKAKIRDYGTKKRDVLMKAKKRLDGLKVKAIAIQKHIKKTKLRTKKNIEQTNRRLGELKEKTESDLGELAARIRKRERKTEKGSLLRNLMKILDES